MYPFSAACSLNFNFCSLFQKGLEQDFPRAGINFSSLEMLGCGVLKGDDAQVLKQASTILFIELTSELA